MAVDPREEKKPDRRRGDRRWEEGEVAPGGERLSWPSRALNFEHRLDSVSRSSKRKETESRNASGRLGGKNGKCKIFTWAFTS